MAHNITASDHMFSGDNQTPWHGLGTVIPGTVSAGEAIKLARCDWEVDVEPVFLGNGKTVDGKVAIIRKDSGDALGIANKSYKPIQNSAVFDFADQLLDQGLEYVTGGSIRGGRNVWALAKMPTDVTVAGDPYRSYLLCASSHDGSLAQCTLPTNVRVVCNNTFTAALRSAKTVHRIRHSGNVDGKIAEARKALDITFSQNDEFVAEMTAMLDQSVTDAAFEAIVHGILPTSKTEGWEANAEIERDKLRRLFVEADTVKAWHGTAYGAVQAVSEWELHAKAKPSTPEDLAFAFMQNRALRHTMKVTDLAHAARTGKAKLTPNAIRLALGVK